ncbi:MAG: helix-turn-helix domain-containing protein [Planctomycetia bacterium]|nr:helix-turn-helix domain-containing protein [Planctomycetia bacterium]
MPVSRSKKLAIARRRQQVADLYIQGWTQTEIAGKVGVGQPTVCNDLQVIQGEWRASMIRDFDLTREVELRKLDRIEREAWAAWERSQKPAQSAELSDGAATPTRKRVKNQYGDPRFLAQINQCIMNRKALLGLDAAPQSTDADDGNLEIQRASVVALVATLRDRAGTAPIAGLLGAEQPGLVRAGDEPGALANGAAPGLPGPGAP